MKKAIFVLVLFLATPCYAIEYIDTSYSDSKFEMQQMQFEMEKMQDKQERMEREYKRQEEERIYNEGSPDRWENRRYRGL